MSLPIHPRTGLMAVGLRRDGRPIWPIFGASDPPDPKKDDPPKADDPPKDPPKADPPKGDEPLGPNGVKALEAEREARKELEKQLKALSPLQKIAEALGGGDAAKGKSEIEQLTERISSHEESLATERDLRWRAEIASDKGLTLKQASRLVGKTKEELTADADELLKDFPAAASSTKPKPDPSQGGAGGSEASGTVATGRDLYRERHKQKQ